MTAYDFTFATYNQLPELDNDDILVVHEMRKRGYSCQIAQWDDAAVDWSKAGVCVIRSTWDYTWRAPEFLKWVEHVSSKAKLFNSAALIRLNWHKRYLLELAAAGIPVIPTVLVETKDSAAAHRLTSGQPAVFHQSRDTNPRANETYAVASAATASPATQDAPSLSEIIESNDWTEVIIKPAVGAGTRGVKRVARNSADAIASGQAHLEHLLTLGDVLVQQYIPSVTTYGERSFIHFNNKFSHALRKVAFRHMDGDDNTEVERAVVATDAELECAQRTLARLPEVPLYARVDIAADADGAPMLMELELIEPSLFFRFDQASINRFCGELLAGS